MQEEKGITSRRDTPEALRERSYLAELNKKPLLQRWRGYLKLSGPAAVEAATTLGAGSFASAVVMGAAYGYKMLWIPLYSYGLGLFMLALAARFVATSDIPIIEAQNKYHTRLVGTFATGIVACYLAMVVFTFGQYALGSDALESLFSLVGINFPRSTNWIIIFIISAFLSLMYGRRGSIRYVRYVENALKLMIAIMLITFLAVVLKTGVNIRAMLRGLLIPTVPRGIEGITIAIAGLTAAMGVGDWVQFHYAMHARGFSDQHEPLARFDMTFMGLLPVTVVLSLVSIAFAEVYSGNPNIPLDSSELAAGLVGVLPSVWIKAAFFIGIEAICISTVVGMSILGATAFCQAVGWAPDPDTLHWKILIMTPQIGLLGAFLGKPIWAVITVASLQSLFNWLSGISWYLLGNDKRYLGEKCVKSRFFNFGILLSVTVLNLVFFTFILSKLGVWPE